MQRQLIQVALQYCFCLHEVLTVTSNNCSLWFHLNFLAYSKWLATVHVAYQSNLLLSHLMSAFNNQTFGSLFNTKILTVCYGSNKLLINLLLIALISNIYCRNYFSSTFQLSKRSISARKIAVVVVTNNNVWIVGKVWIIRSVQLIKSILWRIVHTAFSYGYLYLG